MMTLPSKPFRLATALLAGLLFTSVCQADSNANPKAYDIPEQSLTEALKRFSQQSGLQLFYDAKLAAGLKNPALRGAYTADQALTRLLSQSGLRHHIKQGNTVVLEALPAGDPPKPVSLSSPQSAVTLPKVKVTAAAVNDDNDPYNTSYNRPNATTATKTDTPVMETPVNIQVVPQQVMRDQQAFKLSKVLQNVSGVISDPGLIGNANEETYIRGFETNDTYRNGVRFNGSATGLIETANAERIEVLKGPAAILYGRIQPGGLVNVVTKQPLATPYYSLQQQFGSFDLYRTTADATGPITHDGELQYRLNFAYEDAKSFRQFGRNDGLFIAPVLRWNISPRTQINFELEYQSTFDYSPNGLPVIGNRTVTLPRSTTLNEPKSYWTSDRLLAGLNWTHAFNDNWKIQHNFYWRGAQGISAAVGLDTLLSDNRTMTRYINFPNHYGSDAYTTAMNLTGKFKTWNLEHTLLLGGDYYTWIARPGTPSVTRDFTSIDIFNPVHGGTPGNLLYGNAIFNFNEDWYGFYLQDQVKLPWDFQLLAGFRYDHATSHSTFTDLLSTPPFFSDSRSDDEAVTPRFGLLWRPIPELSFYGNYVENFGAPNLASVNPTGGISGLKPETAQQWEIGAKTELFNGRLTGSLAWFDLTKQNILATDPNNPRRTVLIGEARNRGLELDISGEILPSWRVIVAGAYIDSAITQDSQPDPNRVDSNGNPLGTTSGNTGNRLANVPKFSGSLWTTYNWEDGLFKGLSLGGGAVARSQRQGDNENTFQLPGYASLNLMAGYTLAVGDSKLSLQFNVENLLDKSYFQSSGLGRSSGGNYGSPRAFLGSVRLEY